jgi:hypothetical protein
MVSSGHRRLSPLLGSKPVRSAADHQSGNDRLRSDYRLEPDIFIPASGRDPLRGSAMTYFNDRPILHILLWSAAGIGLVGLACYWIWSWLNS